MKAEILKDQGRNIEYPCLMKTTNGKHYIVLMIKYKSGVVVTDGSHNEIGYYSEDWDMDCFVFFNGEIKLSNF